MFSKSKRSRSLSSKSKSGNQPVAMANLALPDEVANIIANLPENPDRPLPPLPPPPPNLSVDAPVLRDTTARGGTDTVKQRLYVPPSLFDAIVPAAQIEPVYLEPNVHVETYCESSEGVANGDAIEELNRQLPSFDPRTPRVPMGRSKSPIEEKNRLESIETQNMMKALYENQKMMSRSMNILQNRFERMSTFQSHQSHEIVSVPKFKEIDEGGIPHAWNTNSVLNAKNIKSFRELKSIIGLSYSRKMDICDFIRSFVTIVSAVSCDINPLTYNLLLLDSLDDKSKLIVSAFIKEPIDSLSASSFHEIIIACLGNGTTSTIRKQAFFSYDPLTDKAIKLDDLTLNNVIHSITVLGNKASVEKTDIFDKIFSILPESAQMRLENIMANKRLNNPGYVPDHVDISRLLIDSTRTINQYFRNRRTLKGDVMFLSETEEGSVMNTEGQKVFVQDYKVDKNGRTNRRSDSSDESKPYCTNCLMTNHGFKNCRFTALSCQMCGSDRHSTPACTVYKNQTAVLKHCFHCMTKMGLKRHHPAHACLLLKETEKKSEQPKNE